MRTVFLTGASSGIGAAIAESLLEAGDCVFGVGRDFSGTSPDILINPAFHQIALDLRDEKAVEACLSGLFQEGVSFDVLINCAGSAWYGLHEGIAPEHILEMTETDLAVPMVLSGIFLRRFRQQRRGTILNIASVTAATYENPHGAAYGACKAGLLSFSRSIFAEARKCGVKVTCILPDMTDTQLYRNADFAASKEEGCSLTPEDVAGAVRLVLDAPDHLCVPEVVLTPQYHRIEKKKPNQN
jgi:short-subunit dehydrogenase